MSQLTLDALRQAVQMVKDKAEKEEYMVVVNIDDLLDVLRELKRAGYKVTRERRTNGSKTGLFLISEGMTVIRLVPDRFRVTTRGTFLKVPIKRPEWQGIIVPPRWGTEG